MADNTDDNQFTYKNIMPSPVLYKSAFDDDRTQGLVTLADAIECKVIANSNSFPTLQMTYPRDGIGAQLLDYNLIVMTDVSWKWNHQKFRIIQIQRDGDTFLINANHIIADLSYIPIKNDIQIPSANATDVGNQIINNLAGDDHEFVFTSDVSGVSNVNISAGPAVNLFIDPDQEGDTATQSIIGLFGGELEFDNRHIYHHSHAGRTTGIVINYGKNLQTINDDTNLDNTYTAIYPIAKYTPGQAIATEKNTDWANWETDWNSIGTVIYTAGGSVDIYDSPVEGHHVIGKLTQGQKVTLGGAVADQSFTPDKKFQINTVNGDSWYPIKNGGWIDSAWITFDKQGDYIVNKVEGHVTVSGKGTSADAWSNRWHEHGYFVVNYKGYKGGIRWFYDPDFGSGHHPATDKNGNILYGLYGSRWSYDMVCVNSQGVRWYRVGDHQWAYGPHVSVDLAGGNIQIPVKGAGYVKKGAPRYHWQGDHLVQDSKIEELNYAKKTPKKKKYVRGGDGKKYSYNNPAYSQVKPKKVKVTVPTGLKKITKSIKQDGKVYVKTSAGWTLNSYIDYHKLGAQKLQTPSSYINQLSTEGKIEMYADVNRHSDLNWSIPAGVSLPVEYEGKAGDGVTMYQVTYKGKTGWIRSDMTNTKGNIDIEPHSPKDILNSDEDSEEVKSANIPDDKKEVTVEIGTLYAEGTFNQENARILRVDLSSYFTHDDQDLSGQQPDGSFVATQADQDLLRQLAYNYMIEHKFGKPNTSLTVTYQQLSGLAGDATIINLYDYVDVEYDKLGVHQPAEVTSTTWDCLAHRYDQITIGDPPKTWQHILLQAADKKSNERTSRLANGIKQNGSLIQRYRYLLKLETEGRKSDIKRAQDQFMHDIGAVNDVVTKHGKKIGQWEPLLDDDPKNPTSSTSVFGQMKILDEANTKLVNEINGGGHSVIHAVGGWANPTALTAKSNVGGYMMFNGDGLGYFNADGKSVKSAIGADGTVYADVMNAGTLHAVTVDSAAITGAFNFEQNGINVMIGGTYQMGDGKPAYAVNGIGVGSQNYSTYISSGSIKIFHQGMDISTVMNVSSWDADLTLRPSGVYLNGGTIHFGNAQLNGYKKPDGTSDLIFDGKTVLATSGAARTPLEWLEYVAKDKIKGWVEDWVADYVTETGNKGHRLIIWKG
ncbi:phage tail spike protein [Lactobacillus intestinalis]|uniref:phage tail spike protein n=1 Tax=Lactobacillus intestinalis TaxID=151781 RepID=UPI00266FD595|nr:phage tail spike protein [Lactobacillus intestinalis]